MRCIFCKAESSDSRSVEHILPESLGNTKHVLPKGVVCDKCNNYFAKAVEKPFLEAGSVRQLRFDQGVTSKKGRVPTIFGLVDPDIPIQLHRDARDGTISGAVLPELFGRLSRNETNRILLPIGRSPAQAVTSRFFAKVAIESIAARLIDNPPYMDQFVDDLKVEPLRNHARRGQPARWDVHVRQIYPANARTVEAGAWRQVIHESDFLMTPDEELFFVQAIFGMEFTINVGAPQIDGYLAWLDSHDQASPLYCPKNLGVYPMPTDADVDG